MDITTTTPCKRCGGMGCEVNLDTVRADLTEKLKKGQVTREQLRSEFGGISESYLKSLLNGNRDFTGRMLKTLYGDGTQ